MSHVNWAVSFEFIREMAEPVVGQPRPDLITDGNLLPDWNPVAWYMHLCMKERMKERDGTARSR